MKKLGTFLLVAGVVGMVSCGPSQEEKTQDEQNAQEQVDQTLEQVDNEVKDTVNENQDMTDSSVTKSEVNPDSPESSN